MNRLTSDEISELTKAFAFFEDVHGTITYEQLLPVMKFLGQNCSKDEIQDMINEADISYCNGFIGYVEFLKLMNRKKMKGEEKLEEASRAFKEEHGDFTPATELYLVMNNLGEIRRARKPKDD